MNYTSKGLVEAAREGRLLDYIAEHYWEMSNYDLKEVLLSALYVVYDNSGAGATRDEEYGAYENAVADELIDRDFIDEEDED